MNFVKVGDLVVNLDQVTMIRERRKPDRPSGSFVRDGIRVYFARDHYADVGEPAASTVLDRIGPGNPPS